MTEGNASTSRRSQIIDVAIGVFLRYGYARTTMGDIAQASGLSRPTLYLTFPDKESIFEAVVQAMIDSKLAQIRAGLVHLESLEEKLRFACNAWAAEGFELVQAHPDATDMFDLGFRSVCAGYGAFGDLLAEIVKQPLARSSLDLSPEAVARTIVFALRGFEDIATDAVSMRELIAVHVALVVAALDPQSRGGVCH
ncbi:TetR/AcrR family transcriptional regulator [Mesorhizobium sp. M0078]|uniref:TetR/AcrR family transcriptional regulator n=1 Tax=Mesorhizobium sp. M0078 TaxID=2956871 RepID=UPI0033352581